MSSDRVSGSDLVTARAFLDRLLYSVTETLAILGRGQEVFKHGITG